MAGKDISISIGAQNTASSILDQVGKDTKSLGSSVKKMGKDTVAATKTAATGFETLKAAAGPLLAVFAAFKAATAGFAFIGDSAAAFDVQEEAVRGLTKAIELSGDAVGPTIEQHKEWASAMQASVNVGDEVTLGLMKQASTLGVSNDQLQSVTKAAIGLSEATGQGLAESLKKVVGATNGNANALAELIPAIRGASTEAEKLAIINDVATKGLAQQQERAGTAAGSAQRLANSWGDFQEVIGEALAPVRAFISTGLAVLVETISTAVIPALQAIMPSAEGVASAMEMMREGIIKAVTMAEVILANFGSVWEIVKASVELQVIGIVESVKHGFTAVIPAYVEWFSNNFTTMISDAFSLATTIISNYIQNMADIMLALWDYVAGGFTGGADELFRQVGEIAGRSMTEGFIAQTESLPEIAARQLTDSEKMLAGKIDGLATNLGDQYAQKLAERLGASGGLAADALSVALGAGGLGSADSVLGALAGKGKSGGDALSATESRLLTRGRGSKMSAEDALNEIVKNTKQTSSSVQKVADAQAAQESALNNIAIAIENQDSLTITGAP